MIMRRNKDDINVLPIKIQSEGDNCASNKATGRESQATVPCKCKGPTEFSSRITITEIIPIF